MVCIGVCFFSTVALVSGQASDWMDHGVFNIIVMVSVICTMILDPRVEGGRAMASTIFSPPLVDLSTLSIGLSNCKWVFNEVSLTPWGCAVVHFQVKMGHFSDYF